MIVTTVLPSAGSTRLRPLDARGVHVEGGFWDARLATNRTRTIPHGREQLEVSGALGNVRNAAHSSGRYVGGSDDSGLTFPFLDSDVYKWLEAVGWELGREPDPGLADSGGAVIALVEAAQRADGYLNTYVQLSGREPYTDLQWGHELYCIGHLLQAAVAWQRAVGDGRLMAVALRAVDHIEAAMGEGKREAIDGHPEIEMALVEAYRTTGQERLLAFARVLVERRGRGLLREGRMGARYWQDHEPVRSAPTATGHAVRQLYLDSGAVDVAVETGDADLLEAVLRRWTDMWARRTYLTGALGSRHRDEAFGDAFELPSDRAYAETCAAIASVMLAWRLLLATGESRFGDAVERTLYNAVLPGLALEGTAYFYTNPLHVRDRSVATGNLALQRKPWYPCACCPPNVMRTLASFEHRLATADDRGLQLQQLAGARIEAEHAGAPITLRVETDMPWSGAVGIEVEATPTEPWALGLRVPGWLTSAVVHVGDEPVPFAPVDGYLSIERGWRPGDRLQLELAMPARVTLPDERIDAVRGCAAIERGPLVYCVEAADLPASRPADAGIDDLELEPGGELTLADAPGLPPEVVAIEARGRVRHTASGAQPDWPYAAPGATGEASDAPVTLRAIPYFAWANREPGPMRVWLPTRR
jgi:DUF1680 family protein